MSVVGGQLPEQQVDWKPQLSGFGPERVVAVYNPLSDDFRVIYSRPTNITVGLDENAQFARDRTGLDLSKRGGNSGHTTHSIILKAGITTNLPGDLAQKAVQDLITYILGIRTGHKKTADPTARGEVEKEIVLSVKSANDFYNTPPEPDDKLQAEIASLNQPTEVPDPPPGHGVSYVPKSPGPA